MARRKSSCAINCKFIENPFELVKAAYLGEKLSDFDETCAEANSDKDCRLFTKIQNFANTRWQMAAVLKIVVSQYLTENKII